VIGGAPPGGGPPDRLECASCPTVRGYRYAFDPATLRRMAPGVVRALAPSGPAPTPATEEVDETRRNVLKLALVSGALVVGGAGGASALRYLSAPQAGASAFPRVQLLYADGTSILASQYRYSASQSELIVFNYPLNNEPSMLLNLGSPAPGGVGPQQNLVAYSAICQHLGCVPPYISYYPAGTCPSFNGGSPIIHCICHGSTYDPLTAAGGGGAAILTGPAQLPLPQVQLQWDQATDYLYAIGVIGPPVKGHSNTLVGGTPVSGAVTTQAPLTPSQRCPA
jgi:arsenite oxidase small subunit